MTGAPARFLFVVSAYPPLKKAGMEVGCQRLAGALARRGHEVVVLTQHTPGQPAEAQEAPGLRVVRTLRPWALGPLWGLTYMRQVAREARRLAPLWDVAVCHKLYLHSLAVNTVCRGLGRPSLHLLVNAGAFSDLGVVRGHRFGATLLRQTLAGAGGFFVLSRASRDELLAEGVSDDRIRDYRYFVDAARFAPGASPTGRSGHLLYLGRLHPQKNLPLLVEAFETLAPDAARLRIVGGGPDSDSVAARVAASPVATRMEVAGWTNDPAAEYAAAAVSITATNAEGLSNALLEAMACGTPVITTDVSGAREALDPDATAPARIPAGGWFVGAGGLIVPVGDRAALAGAMGLLLGDAALRLALGEQARRRILDAFVEDVVVPRFVQGAMELRP